MGGCRSRAAGARLSSSVPIAAGDEAASEREGGRTARDAIGDAIRDKALELGFDAVGFAPASLGDEARSGLAAFLARGYHGDMGWMAEKADRRGDPQVLWTDARSVVAVALS